MATAHTGETGIVLFVSGDVGKIGTVSPAGWLNVTMTKL